MLVIPAIIASGQSVSAPISLPVSKTSQKGEWDEYALVKIICPTLTNITSVGVQEAWNDAGDSFQDLYDQYGAIVAVPVASGRPIACNPALFASLPPKLKIKANANADAEREFLLVFRKV